MQRQSLGGVSPSSRLPQPPLPTTSEADDEKKTAKSPSKPRRFSIPTTSSSSSSSLSPPSPSSPLLPRQHNFIHVIPLLTLLCFLVLFLFSHDPSPSDLEQFKGFKRSSDLTDPSNAIDGRAYRGGDVVAVRSWRNLQESNKSRVNRKFADF